MTKRRFTQWIVLACMGALAACTSGTGDTAGNTELNILVPDGGADAIDIGTVEYTIHCLGNETPGFLDNNASFDEEVTINGNLEVVDGRTDPNGSIPPEFGVFRPGDGAEIWQGFMDLPPGACTIQLRARDNDGEVICTATEPFNIVADATSKVNLVLICDISFQAPVGMLDVDATFSFNVGNFCPDLFVLNCVESNPPPTGTPFVPPLTYCEARWRDGDSTCGQNCDPQTCVVTPEGLTCTPGPDPGVSTTVTCDANGLIDCDGDFVLEPSCTWSGDATGAVGAGLPVPVILGGPGPLPGGFYPGCAFAAAPGAVVTCTAVTTDGDTDCDKTKQVSFNCPGLNFCDQVVAGDNLTDCDDGNECTTDSCDRTAGVCVNDPVPAGGGNNCDSGGGSPGECDGNGVCGPFGCTSDLDCTDGNECTDNGTCNLGTGLCSASTPNTDPCNGGAGTCDGAGSCVDNCAGVDCSDGDVCTDDVCTSIGGPTCSNPAGNEGGACDAGGGPGSGTCQSGVCAAPPVVGACSDSVGNQALPTTATGCTYDAVATTCTGCTITGPSVPGGGQCGQFGAQIVGGCEVPGGVLNAQLAIDVTITLDIVSTGDGNVTHDFSVNASNPALGTAAGLVSVDAASLFASVSTGVPAQLQNDLNPAFAGNVLGFFTGGGNILLLDSDPVSVPGAGVEIPTVVTAVTPTSSPNVNFNYDTFSLLLTIQASGTPLLVDDAGCIFDVTGADVVCPVL